MGLSTTSQQNEGATFVTIRTGTDAKGRKQAIIAKRCDEGTPKAKQAFKADGSPALTKDGDTVWRLEFTELSGRIVKLEKHEADFGDGKKQNYLHIHIKDGQDLYILSLDRGDRYWSDFLLRLPMVEPTKDVIIRPYSISDDDGKLNQGVSMKQGGQKVERKWSKERGYEGGPPQPTFDEDEQEWKWGKRNKWMEDNILQPIADEINSMDLPDEPKASGYQAAPAPTIADMPPVGNDEDDLPF